MQPSSNALPCLGDMLAPKGENSELRFEIIGLLRQSLDQFNRARDRVASLSGAGKSQEKLSALTEAAARAFHTLQYARITADLLRPHRGNLPQVQRTFVAIKATGLTLQIACNKERPKTFRHFHSGLFVQHYCGPDWAELDRCHWETLDTMHEEMHDQLSDGTQSKDEENFAEVVAVLRQVDTEQLASLVKCGKTFPASELMRLPAQDPTATAREEWLRARDALAQAMGTLPAKDCGLGLGNDYTEPLRLHLLLRKIDSDLNVPAGLPGVLALLLEERSAVHFTPDRAGAFQVFYRTRARIAAWQPDFWQWWLLDHLRASAEKGEKVSPASVASLIELALCSPKRLRTAECPANLAALKTGLQSLCFLWAGARPSLEERQLLATLSQANPATIAVALGVFIKACLTATPQLLHDRAFTQAIQDTLRKRLLPRLDELIESYTITKVGEVTTSEELKWTSEWEALLAEEAAQQALLAKEQAAVAQAQKNEVATTISTEPETPPAAATIRVRFLTNPGAEAPKFHEPMTLARDDIAPFQELVESVGLESDIPIASIARAVSHYVWETPVVIRACMNKMTFSGITWHKVKRGKMRIYMRMNSAEELQLSVIMRRDWNRLAMEF